MRVLDAIWKTSACPVFPGTSIFENMKNASVVISHRQATAIRGLVCLLFLTAGGCLSSFEVSAQPRQAPAAGETPAKTSFMDIIMDDVEIVGRDWLAYNTAPLSFSRSDWLLFGGVAGGTAGLLFLDESIQSLILGSRQSDLYAASVDLAWTGHLIAADIASGLVYLSGLFSRSDALRVTGRMMGQSLIYAGTVALILRFLSGRRWPAANEGAFSFDTWPPDDTYHAFPSGHTVVVFTLATVLAQRIDSWPVTVLLYGTAVAAGLGRMYIDQHWASDVFLGAVLGFTTARFVLAREAERGKGEAHTSNWILTPTGSGLSFTLRF